MDNYVKEDLLKDNVKEKIKLLYKDIVIEDIKDEVEKSKIEVIENINNKKRNKDILNKLDQLLIMVDMIENKEEKGLRSIAMNNRINLIVNCILAVIIVLGFIFNIFL